MFNEQRCPKCGEFGFATQESRKTREAIRRRRVCSNCDYRQTTYEVSQVWYREAQRNRDIVSKLEKLIGSSYQSRSGETKSFKFFCSMCTFMTDRGCSFGFPEAGGDFATECSQYDPVKHG